MTAPLDVANTLTQSRHNHITTPHSCVLLVPNGLNIHVQRLSTGYTVVLRNTKDHTNEKCIEYRESQATHPSNKNLLFPRSAAEIEHTTKMAIFFMAGVVVDGVFVVTFCNVPASQACARWNDRYWVCWDYLAPTDTSRGWSSIIHPHNLFPVSVLVHVFAYIEILVADTRIRFGSLYYQPGSCLRVPVQTLFTLPMASDALIVPPRTCVQTADSDVTYIQNLESDHIGLCIKAKDMTPTDPTVVASQLMTLDLEKNTLARGTPWTCAFDFQLLASAEHLLAVTNHEQCKFFRVRNTSNVMCILTHEDPERRFMIGQDALSTAGSPDLLMSWKIQASQSGPGQVVAVEYEPQPPA
jgi:hypothetical protein